MEPDEEYREIMKAADNNIRRWRKNLKTIDELWAECKRLNLVTSSSLHEKRVTIKPNSLPSCTTQIVEELQKQKYYLGRNRRNGIIQQYRRNCK
jgi:hypothetical protein